MSKNLSLPEKSVLAPTVRVEEAHVQSVYIKEDDPADDLGFDRPLFIAEKRSEGTSYQDLIRATRQDRTGPTSKITPPPTKTDQQVTKVLRSSKMGQERRLEESHDDLNESFNDAITMERTPPMPQLEVLSSETDTPEIKPVLLSTEAGTIEAESDKSALEENVVQPLTRKKKPAVKVIRRNPPIRRRWLGVVFMIIGFLIGAALLLATVHVSKI